MMKLKLQLFNEPGADGGAQPGEGQGTDGGADNQSFDDLLGNKDYQSEFDRRINKAINTAKANWEKELADKQQEAQTEAQRLAQMTAEQKADYEKQKQADRIAELERKTAMFELGREATKMLSEHNITADDELLDYVVRDNAEATKQSVESFVKMFNAKVQAEVDKRLVGSVDLPAGAGNPNTSTKVGERGKALAQRNQPQQKQSNYFKN